MKTNPIFATDGSLRSFEIAGGWFSFRPLYRILRSVQGVSDVRRNWFGRAEIFSFTFHGEPFVIRQDWGTSDNRYSVEPKGAAAAKLDMSPLHRAFEDYRAGPIRRWMINSEFDDTAGEWYSALLVMAAACALYFYLLDELPGAYLPGAVAWVAVLLPIAACGLLHFRTLRDSPLSPLRRWTQIAGAAILAPLLGWFLAYVLHAGAS